jgi:hypothetical protein
MRIEFIVTDGVGKNYQGVAELSEVSAGREADKHHVRTVAELGVNGLPGRILALREDNFFREPRTPVEVHAKLMETYHCLLNRVQMALLRLHRRRDLRKTVKKIGDQDQAAYVW